MPIPKLYDKDFFKTWSSDMAYILGFMYADGNIVETKRGNHYVAIYTADEALLVEMAKCIKSDHKISLRNVRSGHVYRIQVGSKTWFEDLNNIGLHPNKSKRMVLPHIPKKLFGDFLRGYFDGDGNVWMGYLNKHRTTPTLVLQASFTSGSVDFLRKLLIELQYLGITGGAVYEPKTRNFGRLTLSSLDALKIYKIMYTTGHKLHLKRKKVVFEQFIKQCGRSSAG